MKAEAREHRRAFTAFLAKTMPQQLEDLSERAADRARRRLRKQTAEGEGLHWATLNAALMRNGAFQGVAKVDYPGALTRAFVDVVGGSWEQMVVDSVRAALKTLSAADAELVERLCGSATEILQTEELNVTIKDIRAQLREQGKTSVTWTQAQLEELSDDVRTRLFEVVAKPIEQACRAAQRAGRNRGAGARSKILEVFDEGGTAAIEAARRACVAILEDHLKGLARSLGGILRDNYDPVTHVFDTIVDAQSEMIAQMSDQRRREQLSAIRAVIKRMKSLADNPAAEAVEEEAPPMSRPGIVVAPGANSRDAGDDIFDGV